MARVDIRGPIVPNDYGWYYRFFGEDHTCPSYIQKAVDGLKDGEDLDVYINSPGGEIASGSEIYAILRNCQATKLHITGEAHSAASIVAMSGWCEMAPTALMMVHCVSTFASGNHSEMEKTAEILSAADRALCTAYMEKSGMSQEQALDLMENTTWLTAENAKKLGLIDRIMFEEENDHRSMAAAAGGFRLPSQADLDRARKLMEAKTRAKALVLSQRRR